MLISQYFLPESDPTERFRDTLRNKGFSAACDPTATKDERARGRAMTTAILLLIVPGVVLLALAVDVAALVGWLRRCVGN